MSNEGTTFIPEAQYWKSDDFAHEDQWEEEDGGWAQDDVEHDTRNDFTSESFLSIPDFWWGGRQIEERMTMEEWHETNREFEEHVHPKFTDFQIWITDCDGHSQPFELNEISLRHSWPLECLPSEAKPTAVGLANKVPTPAKETPFLQVPLLNAYGRAIPQIYEQRAQRSRQFLSKLIRFVMHKSRTATYDLPRQEERKDRSGKRARSALCKWAKSIIEKKSDEPSDFTLAFIQARYPPSPKITKKEACEIEVTKEMARLSIGSLSTTTSSSSSSRPSLFDIIRRGEGFDEDLDMILDEYPLDRNHPRWARREKDLRSCSPWNRFSDSLDANVFVSAYNPPRRRDDD